MNTLAVYVGAALAEIGGCFAFWMWLRLHRTSWLGIVGIVSLVIFAVILTRSEAVFAGRAYAAYGGVYIMASLVCGCGLWKECPLTGGTWSEPGCV